MIFDFDFESNMIFLSTRLSVDLSDASAFRSTHYSRLSSSSTIYVSSYDVQLIFSTILSDWNSSSYEKILSVDAISIFELQEGRKSDRLQYLSRLVLTKDTQ